MSAKTDILRRLHNAQALSRTPESVTVPRDYHRSGEVTGVELRDLLIDRLEDYRATVVVSDAAHLPEALRDVLAGRGCQHVTLAPGLDATALASFDGVVAIDDPATDPRQLNDTDAVITDSHVSCAETGTIVLEASATNGRRALSLVPDRHICLVRESTIVHRVPEMIARLDPQKPATMISGPSATSDIELSRVEGVHGPRDLIVVIVTD